VTIRKPGMKATSVNWKYGIGEVFLIVVGVSIALAANSWYESRKLRGDETAILSGLQATLREDLERVHTGFDTITDANQRIKLFVNRVESDGLSQPDIDDGIGAIMRFVTLHIRYGPYETLKARGIDLVSDESLRVRITTLYEDELPNLIEDSEIDRRRSTEQYTPYIIDHFWLEESGQWVPKELPGVNWRRDLATLGRHRARTLDGFYLPSFAVTTGLMSEILSEIETELSRRK